jgi:hypothetical protein
MLSDFDKVIPLVAAAALLVGRVWYDRTAGGRRAARAIYGSGAFPGYLRAGPATAPLLAVGALVAQLGLLAPPGIDGRLVCLGLGIVGAAGALGYRRPPPLASSWMRDELAAGTLAIPEWDWLDKFQCAVLALGAVGLTAVGTLGLFGGIPR